MLSYGNVLLADPLDPDAHAPGGMNVSAWIEANIKPEEIFPLASIHWPGTITGGPILERTIPPWMPVRINRLSWPTTASRFAQAHFVVNDDMLTAIRRQAIYNGTLRALPLVMSHLGQQISTQMWMLPARPLGQPILPPGNQGGLWLLTLVDDRYWWWDVPLFISFGGPGVHITWGMLYAQVGRAVGTTIVVDTIPTAYGSPTSDYAVQYRPVPPYLDTVAFSVGQKIVRGLDGTVKAQNAATAIANAAAQADQYIRYVGGRLSLKPGD